MAPALLIFRFAQGDAQGFGWAFVLVYAICACLRLARFNVSHSTDSFSGLPSPIAGIAMALIPIAFHDPATVKSCPALFVPAYIITALLMVSTVRFSKPQSYIFKKIHGIQLVVLALILIGLAVVLHKIILFIVIGLMALYIVSGIVSFIIQFIQDHKY